MSMQYFHKYLEVAPFALALWRSPEAEAIAKASKKYDKRKKKINSFDAFTRPLLDVGCGFGEFAGVFFDRQVEVGIDISIEDLILAKQGKKYKRLIPADAKKLPFKNNTFETVLSVSVLEHIYEPQYSIGEIFRVLKPKGLFYFTVPTTVLNETLAGSQILRAIGLDSLANNYLEFYHKIFKHVTLKPPQYWSTVTKKTGFTILEERGTFNALTVFLFEIFLLTALPSQVTRWMIGKRWVWAVPLKKFLLTPLYAAAIFNKNTNMSNVLFVAQKP